MLTLLIQACMWSTFSIRSLSVLIIVILNSLSDKSNIYVIFMCSSSDLSFFVCFLVLLFGMHWNVLLKARYVV